MEPITRNYHANDVPILIKYQCPRIPAVRKELFLRLTDVLVLFGRFLVVVELGSGADGIVDAVFESGLSANLEDAGSERYRGSDCNRCEAISRFDEAR